MYVLFHCRVSIFVNGNMEIGSIMECCELVPSKAWVLQMSTSVHHSIHVVHIS